MKTLEYMTETELADLMRSLAMAVETACKILDVEKPHFTLVVFNDPKIAQYVSNCQRADMITAMRETANRLASKQDVSR